MSLLAVNLTGDHGDDHNDVDHDGSDDSLSSQYARLAIKQVLSRNV